MSGGVKVAVRVRPFNSREKKMKATLIIGMQGPMTSIKNPENGQVKPFTFDYSYWSHDQYEDQDGLLVATGPKYATQLTVYEDVGVSILNNCFEGFNTSLFAYGQTGSGKSYSMVGYGKNKGIIPIICENLFIRCEEGKKDPNVSYQVTVTMLEIYNEKLRDLLHPAKGKNANKKGLKIRSGKMGVYIPGLKPDPVDSYDAIDRKMQEGTMNRTVASTKMNATSSRAHTIFGIMFTKVTVDGERKTEMVSKINLVDLAGSERANSTGATGDRLKEGCAINQSLSSLGNVISALADKAMGKKKVFVPYRNSVLTMMLQDALGGNSKTIMICALSPADVNYEETLSTLRYADRAKKIKNKVVKNENPTDKAIRLLKEENARLKKLLADQGVDVGAAAAAGPAADPAEMKKLKDKLAEMEENQRMIDEMKKSWEQKVAESKERSSAEASGPSLASDASKLTVPYLINLHEDESMSETFLHKLPEGITRFGRADADTPQDIQLTGLGIRKEHCTFENKEGTVSVTPLNDGKTFVNGDRISEATELTMGDRVIIGSNFFFRFQTPGDTKEMTFKTFKETMDELMSKQSNNMSDAVNSQMSKLFGAGEKAEAKNAELERKLKEMEEKMRIAQAESKKKLAAMQQKIQSGEISASDAALAAMSPEEKKLLEEKEKVMKEKRVIMARRKLEKKIDKLVPRVKEVNQIAKEMSKPLDFELKLQQRSDCLDMISKDQADRLSSFEFVVRVKNTSSGAVWIWSTEKFDQRRYMIQDMFMEFQEGALQNRSNESDPFWDPPQATKIGRAIVYLKALSHLVEIEPDEGTDGFTLYDSKGKSVGSINLNIFPNGLDDEELDYLDSPEELLGTDFKLDISIDSAKNIPENYANHLHANLLFYGQTFQTPMVEAKTTNPQFNYRTSMKFENADEQLLKYLQEKAAVLEISGFPDYLTPTAELACEHCDEARGVLFCKECDKKYCQKCFGATHKSKKKKGHTAKPLGEPVTVAEAKAPTEAPKALVAASALDDIKADEVAEKAAEDAAAAEGKVLCAMCEESPAEVRCLDCDPPDGKLFCNRCWKTTHKKKSKRGHRTVPLAGGDEKKAPPADEKKAPPADEKKAPAPETKAPAPAAAEEAKAAAPAAADEAKAAAPAAAPAAAEEANKKADESKETTAETPAPAAAAGGGEKPICGHCEEAPATVSCVECDKFYCDNCNRVKHKAKSKKGHVRKPISEVGN